MNRGIRRGITEAGGTNSTALRNTSTLPAHASAGEETVLTGSTATGTLTLPGASAQVSTVNTVLNLASVSVTLAPGPGTTLNAYGTTGSLTVLTGQVYSAILVGAVWYVIGSSTPSADVTLDQFGAAANPVNVNGQRLLSVTPQAVTDGANALGQLLAAHYYEPTSLVNKQISSSTAAAVDTTNLTLSFTAISTAVVIELTAQIGFFTNTASPTAEVYWGLFSHGTTTQVGYYAAAFASASTTAGVCATVKIHVTGLTAGASYQYDWAHGVTGTCDAIMTIGCLAASATVATGNAGPAIMRAFAA